MKKILFVFFVFTFSIVSYAQSITGKLIDQNSKGLSGLQLQLYISPKVYNVTSGLDGSFIFNNISDVKSDPLPTGYKISDNYPNPFNPKTRIELTLPSNANVRVNIYNLLGQKVIAELERNFSAGTNSIDIELNGLPNGFYLANILINEKYSVVKKLMLIYGSQHLANSHITPVNSLYKSAQATIIDSLVVTGNIFGKATFKNLPNMIGNSLNLGSLNITIPPPSIPVLLSPNNYSVDLPLSPTITWNSAQGAESYTLQVSTSNTFTNFIFNQSGLSGISKQVSALSSLTAYYWRVCAVNSYGTSQYSAVRSFTTIGSAPNPFIGTWKLTLVTVTVAGSNVPLTPEQAGTQMTIVAGSDASYKETTTNSGGTVVQNGVWRINGPKLEIYYDDGSSQSLEFTVNGNKFTIKTTVNALNTTLPALLEFTKQ